MPKPPLNLKLRFRYSNAISWGKLYRLHADWWYITLDWGTRRWTLELVR